MSGNNNDLFSPKSNNRPTEADVEFHRKHSPELFRFVREGDVPGFQNLVRELLKDGDSTKFRCCNAYGESLLHLTCRRGRTEMARFLLEGMHRGDTNESEEQYDSSARRVIAASVDD